MENMLFRCTQTGLNVQVCLADRPSPDEAADSYEPIGCPACGRVHLIHRASGRMLGEVKAAKLAERQ